MGRNLSLGVGCENMNVDQRYAIGKNCGHKAAAVTKQYSSLIIIMAYTQFIALLSFWCLNDILYNAICTSKYAISSEKLTDCLNYAVTALTVTVS
jgi:hypothetical protein